MINRKELDRIHALFVDYIDKHKMIGLVPVDMMTELIKAERRGDLVETIDRICGGKHDAQRPHRP